MPIQLEQLSPPGKFWNRKDRRLWLGTLMCGCACLYAARTAMPLCSVSISKEYHWDKTDSGTVLSAFFWGYALTQVIGGYISDRVGGVRVLMTASIGWILVTFWTPQIIRLTTDKSTMLAITVFSRVLIGGFQGVHYPSLTSVLAQRVSEDERAFSFALAASGSQVGCIFTGSVGSLLLEHYGWTSPFHLIGIFGMIWLLFLRYYVVAQDKRKARILSVKDDLSMEAPSNEVLKVPWRLLMSKSAFWSILLGHYALNNTFFVLLSWLPTYFNETFPEAQGWVFNVVPWVVSIPCSVSSGWLADKLIAEGHSTTVVRKIMETVALCGTAFFLICISFTTTFGGALFCMAGSMACTGFHSAGILVNPQDIAPKYSGSVFGLMNTAGAIPGFVGVYIAGYVLETTHSWSAVFNQTAVVCLIGWVIYMIFGTGKKIV